jgi:hypothetical protein
LKETVPATIGSDPESLSTHFNEAALLGGDGTVPLAVTVLLFWITHPENRNSAIARIAKKTRSAGLFMFFVSSTKLFIIRWDW